MKIYAAVLDGYTPPASDPLTSSDPLGTQRHLRFAQQHGGRVGLSGHDVLSTTSPAGAVIDPAAEQLASNARPVAPAQANQIEMIISPTGKPSEQYHFVSTIANRSN